MKRRIVSILVSTLILISNFSVLAANVDYTPGPKTQNLILEDITSLSNGDVSSGTLALKKDGVAEFEYIQLFDALSATIKYKAEEDVNLTITTQLGSNVHTLFADKTEDTINLYPELRRNVQKVWISADRDITISGITFNKIDYYPLSSLNKCVVEYPEYMDAVKSTVVISSNANAIKVNGAMRYIDYADRSETPLVENGRMYLPVKPLARAFSLYFEDYPDLEYVYLSNDTFELYTTPQQSYTIVNAVKTIIERPVIYKNGEAFMPVRLVAELLGETVGYRDGLAVIDNKVAMKNILTDEAVFQELKNEFSEFEVSKKVTGKTYYVSKAAYASDANNGSKNFPFATISKAAEVAAAGDTVIIHEGVYYEEVVPKNDGTASSPIIFKAAEGENVSISAMEPVTDFRHYKDNIYCAIVPGSLGAGRDFVIINGKAVVEGRHPNTDTHPVSSMFKTDDPVFERNLFPTIGDLIVTKDKVDMTRENYKNDNNADVTNIEISSRTDLNQEQKDYWKGAYVIAMHSGGWTLSSGEVVASEKGKITVIDPAPDSYGFTYYSAYPDSADFGYLTNHINTVDMPGEWYIDKNTNIIYLIPPEGIEGSSLTIELKQRQRVIDLRNRKGITFENINTYGGGITMKDSELCVINGGTHKYISQFTFIKDTHTGSYDTETTDPNWAPGRGEMGEYISGKNNAFINAEINGSAAAGLYIAGIYNYIDNNLVLNTDYGGIYPSGITIEGERWKDSITSPRGGHTVTGNTSKYAGRGTYYNSQNWRTDDEALGKTAYPIIACEVAFNEFAKGCINSRDGGVTYEHGTTGGSDLMMTNIHHNIIYDHVGQRGQERDLSMLVYRDGSTTMQEFYSNILFNSTEDTQHEAKVPEKHMLFKQVGTHADCYNEDYNNKIYMYYPDGVANLQIEHFPSGKPFKVGIENGYDRMMKNYERVVFENVYYVGDTKLENGAYIDGQGVGRIDKAQSSFTIENVQLSANQKKLTLYIIGDRYNMEVNNLMYDIIQNGKTVYTSDAIITGGGRDVDDLVEHEIYIPANISGISNIKIYTNTGSNHGFVKFMVSDYEGEIPERVYPTGSYIIPAGMTAEVINPASSTTALTYKRNLNGIDTLSHFRLGDVWDRTIRYDLTTSTDIDTIRLRMSTGRSWSYGTVTLYVDSLNSEPVGVIDVEQSYNEQFDPEYKTWTQLENTEFKFNKHVPAGTHSYYLVFETNNHGKFCVDFYNIALFNSMLASNADGR